jgi:hypothetical protein
MKHPLNVVNVDLLTRQATFLRRDYQSRITRPLDRRRLFRLLTTLNSLADRGCFQIFATTTGSVAARESDAGATLCIYCKLPMAQDYDPDEPPLHNKCFYPWITGGKEEQPCEPAPHAAN